MPIVHHTSLNQRYDRELHLFLSMIFLRKEYSHSIDRGMQLKHINHENSRRVSQNFFAQIRVCDNSGIVRSVRSWPRIYERSHNIWIKSLIFYRRQLYFHRVYAELIALASRRKNKNFAWIYENRHYSIK